MTTVDDDGKGMFWIQIIWRNGWNGGWRQQQSFLVIHNCNQSCTRSHLSIRHVNGGVIVKSVDRSAKADIIVVIRDG
jgi:hypothetical protein